MTDDDTAKGHERAPAPGRWRRHGLKLAVAIVLLVAVGIYAVHWLSWRASHVSADDARIQARLINVASRVDGWLTARPPIEGDHVGRGDVLATLDKRDTQLRLKALQSRIEAAAAQVAQYRTKRRTTERTTQASVDDANAQVTAAQAALAQARHQADLAEKEFARIDRLLKSHSVSQQEWDSVHATLLQRRDASNHARAQLAARKADQASARAQMGEVDVLARQIDVAQRQQQALSAQADQLKQELADRTLKSPIDGVVDKTMVNVGDYVQSGQWMMMIHDPDRVWVEANIKETEIGRVKVGQPVDISVDAYPGLTLHGKVLRVGNAATSEFAMLPSPNPSGSFTKITQRVPVRIAFDRRDARLKPGLMVEVSIDVAD